MSAVAFNAATKSASRLTFFTFCFGFFRSDSGRGGRPRFAIASPDIEQAESPSGNGASGNDFAGNDKCGKSDGCEVKGNDRNPVDKRRGKRVSCLVHFGGPSIFGSDARSP